MKQNNLNNSQGTLFYPEQHSKFKEIKRLIEQNNKIVILGHVRPDGDCIGGQLAFLHALQKRYPQKEIYAPFAGDEQRFRFLLPKNYHNIIKTEELKNSLVIVVDVSTPERLPIEINQAKTIIQIDHHSQWKKFGTITWIDEHSIAACEMLYFLFIAIELPINQKVANALLTGIITDSGSFCYRKTRAQTFWAASQLMIKKANLNQINTTVYEKKETDLATIKWILNNYIKKTKLAVIKFSPQDRKKLPHVQKKEDIKKFVNFFENIKEIKIWAMFVQLEINQPVFVSIRSRKTAINQIAQKYGGGGHENAAGIELKDWTLVPKIIENLSRISRDD